MLLRRNPKPCKVGFMLIDSCGTANLFEVNLWTLRANMWKPCRWKPHKRSPELGQPKEFLPNRRTRPPKRGWKKRMPPGRPGVWQASFWLCWDELRRPRYVKQSALEDEIFDLSPKWLLFLSIKAQVLKKKLWTFPYFFQRFNIGIQYLSNRRRLAIWFVWPGKKMRRRRSRSPQRKAKTQRATAMAMEDMDGSLGQILIGSFHFRHVFSLCIWCSLARFCCFCGCFNVLELK